MVLKSPHTRWITLKPTILKQHISDFTDNVSLRLTVCTKEMLFFFWGKAGMIIKLLVDIKKPR